LTTDGPPGSFAAVGLAPHHVEGGTFFTAVQFSSPSGAKTSTTVFPGLPVGHATLLPGGDYVPELSVANFSGSPAHVTVKYSQTTGDTPEVKTVTTLVVPAGGTATADLKGLQGDSGLQNSFEVVSDQAPGEVVDNIASKSETGTRRVELPGKDLDSSHNGGNHPWTVADGTDSTLLLFNQTAASENFTVRVASGQAVWMKKYTLAALATKAIDINELIQDQVKDDNGYALPSNIQSGQANWATTGQFAGAGRLLQSNPALHAARSFSCGEYLVIIGASMDQQFGAEAVGATGYLGTLYSAWGLTEDTWSCYGSYLEENPSGTYDWQSLDPSIAAISGSTGGAGVSVQGLSSGAATIYGEVWDQYGCSANVDVTVDVTPEIDSIYPPAASIQDGTEVTISGVGFGTSPTLNLPTGMTASGQTSSNSTITVTLSGDSSSVVGAGQVSVNANGQTSNSYSLDVDGPWELEVTDDTSFYCSGCANLERDVTYQIFNYSGSDPGAVTICETPSFSGWSCTQSQPRITAAWCSNPSDWSDAYGGVFTDQWSLGSGSYTPSGCGYSLTDPWYWVFTTPNTLMGVPAGFLHTNAIENDGVTTPSQLTSGTIMPK